MKLCNYINPDLVAFLDATTRREVIDDLVRLAEKKGIVSNQKTFLQAVYEREGMVSTGIGMGIAIPHARLPEYDTFFIIVGISRKGIIWDSIDGLPVRIIFLVGGPPSQQSEYLKLLSQLTVVLKEEEKRSKLLNSTESEEITKLLNCG